MTAQYATLVNGHEYSFASIRLTATTTVGRAEFSKFVEINYEHALEVGPLRGAGPIPQDEAWGEYTANGSIIMYLDDWRSLRALLAALPGYGGYMQKRFTFDVSYAEEQKPTCTDMLRNCRVTRVGRAYRRGSEPLMISIGIYIREVIEDGIEAVQSSDLITDDDLLSAI